MPFVHQPVWSNQYDSLDPEYARVREEVKQRAVRDATSAMDAVRAKLRRNLTTATRKAGRNPNQAQRTAAST